MKAVLWCFLLLMPLAVTARKSIVHPNSYYKKFNKDGKEHTMWKYKEIGKYCKIGGNRKVVKSGVLTDDEIQQYLKVQNDYRRRVAKGQEKRGAPGPQPQAANMMELTWDPELAAIAQRWAQQCPGEGETAFHDDNRRVGRYRWVGQNVFKDHDDSVPMFGSKDPPITANAEKASSFFYLESTMFNKANIDPFQYDHKTAHYSQMLWANTRKIGCGFFMIKERRSKIWYIQYVWYRFTVCNYGPGGNIPGLRMYKIGPSGSACPSKTVNKDGLCSYTSKKHHKGRGCGRNMFTCKSGQCISFIWRCDNHKDCPDGSDEKGCSKRTCDKNEFRCASGQCVPQQWVCDGVKNCKSGEDEKGCKCNPKKEFQCSGGGCINRTKLCDGHADCKDASDERRHSCKMLRCGKHHYKCQTSQCIPSIWVCDGKKHCPSGEDEKGCASSKCKKNQFRCNNGQCVSNIWRCDGVTDCKDKSDELQCACKGGHKNQFKCEKSGKCIPMRLKCDGKKHCMDGSDENDQTCQYAQCGKDKFKCRSGQCIKKTWKCDGDKDCRDGSDEKDCSKNN